MFGYRRRCGYWGDRWQTICAERLSRGVVTSEISASTHLILRVNLVSFMKLVSVMEVVPVLRFLGASRVPAPKEPGLVARGASPWNVNARATEPQRGDRKPEVEARRDWSKHNDVGLLD